MNLRIAPKQPVELDTSPVQFDARPRHPVNLDEVEAAVAEERDAQNSKGAVRKWEDPPAAAKVAPTEEALLDNYAKLTLRLTWGDMMQVCLKSSNGEEDKANALAKSLDGWARVHLGIGGAG
jgi:hypothetical protein